MAKKNIEKSNTGSSASGNITPTVSNISSAKVTKNIESHDMLFGKTNYMYILAGIGLMTIGFFLMSGGKMPSPDVWDESIIYSPVRILVAPIFIIAGLVMQVLAIFKK